MTDAEIVAALARMPEPVMDDYHCALCGGRPDYDGHRPWCVWRQAQERPLPPLDTLPL